MNKAIIPTAQMLGLVAPAAAGLAAAGLIQQQAAQNRTASEAMMTDGLLGVLSDRVRQSSIVERPVVARQEAISAPRQQQRDAPMQAAAEEQKEQAIVDQYENNDADESEPLLSPEERQIERVNAEIQADIPRLAPVQDQPMNINQAMQVADDMVQQADEQIRQDVTFYKWLPAMLVGIKYYSEINSIVNRIYDLYRAVKESDSFKAGSDGPIEVKIRRPIPSNCQRHIYKDQFGTLRSIVYCRRVDGSMRVYEDQ